MSAEVWSLVEISGGRPTENAWKMASEARRVAELMNLQGCVVSVHDVDDADPVALALARYGVKKIYVGSPGSAGDGGPERVAREIALLVRHHQPELVMFPATSVGADIGARVAAQLHGGLIANCVDFSWDGKQLTARSTSSGGKAHSIATWTAGGVRLATMHMASLEAIAQDGEVDAAELVQSAATEGQLRTRSVQRWRLPPDEIDLTEAEFIIGVGRPVDRERDLPLIRELADRIGATVGGSRVSVFQGTLPVSKQIGASGKWIKPQVYLTLGISGASYHLMGIKGAQHIIAVNSDPDAPILKVAELGVIGDFQKVVAALLATSQEPDGGSAA